MCPHLEAVPTESFEEAFAAVRAGEAERAMIPIENSVAGRVADIHHLMPHAGLKIIGEHFQRVNHHLLAVPGARLEDIKTVHSHVHAPGPVPAPLERVGADAKAHADTAGAAAEMSPRPAAPIEPAIASRLAAEIYGLDILRSDLEDAEHNTTRFVILAREAREPRPTRGR